MTRAARRIGVGGLCAAVGVACGGAPSRNGGGAEVRTLLAQALPLMDGSALRTTLLEVAYRPGGSSTPHRHPCAVIGYVIEGALRSQAEGEPETIYHAGESFYENPNTMHQVSANASDRHPARFAAFFLCDHDTPLSVAVQDTDRTQGGKR